MEDGNPYTQEWANLNVVVTSLIKKHKQSEMEWTKKNVKRCTDWMKRLNSLMKKLQVMQMQE